MKYLIVLFSESGNQTELKEMSSSKELIEFINDHPKGGLKFAVHEIGDCILDWS